MTDYIGYEALTQAAMRGLVREALRRAKGTASLPGDHHFYISFRTRAPGVKIPGYLAQKFPEEMTVVIQHQYWDLDVNDTQFEVVLKFGGVPHHLEVPFTAITRFVDPAVNFLVTFEGRSKEADIIAPERQAPRALQPPAPVSQPASTVVSLDAYRRK